jgi:hypothetical protein
MTGGVVPLIVKVARRKQTVVNIRNGGATNFNQCKLSFLLSTELGFYDSLNRQLLESWANP